jgi:hypothetical protein
MKMHPLLVPLLAAACLTDIGAYSSTPTDMKKTILSLLLLHAFSARSQQTNPGLYHSFDTVPISALRKSCITVL